MVAVISSVTTLKDPAYLCSCREQFMLSLWSNILHWVRTTYSGYCAIQIKHNYIKFGVTLYCELKCICLLPNLLLLLLVEVSLFKIFLKSLKNVHAAVNNGSGCMGRQHVHTAVNLIIVIQNNIEICNTHACAIYRIAGKFGGELNLAVWRSAFATAKLKSTKISYLRIYIWRSRTEPPN